MDLFYLPLLYFIQKKQNNENITFFFFSRGQPMIYEQIYLLFLQNDVRMASD